MALFSSSVVIGTAFLRFTSSHLSSVITTGFMRVAGDELIKAGLTQAHMTGRRYAVTRYQVTGEFAGYLEHRDPISFPEIVHGNNDSWSLLNGGDGDLHASLFLRNTYGKGRMYILAVPDNDADLYRMPMAAVDVIRRALSDGLYMSGRDCSMFSYDDGSLILYSYVKGDLHPDVVSVHTDKEVKALKCTTSEREFEVRKVTLREDFETREEYVADVLITPGLFEKYVWID